MADITDKTEATEPLNALIKATENQLEISRFSAHIYTSCIQKTKNGNEATRVLDLRTDTILELKLLYKCLKYDGGGRFDVIYRPVGLEPSEGFVDICLYERRDSSDTFVASQSVGDHVAYKKTGKTIEAYNSLPVATQNYEKSLDAQLGVLFEMLNNDLYPVVTGEEVFTLDIPKKDWREGY